MSSVNELYWALAEKADKKFVRLRDLPLYGGNKWDAYFHKAFQVYTKLWKYQQENRQALVDAGLKRWEIGEIASRIGQLYYNFYVRTSDATFLSESYIFYDAIVNREYFKDTGKDAALANKHLRFFARFIVVCLLLNRRDKARHLIQQLRTLVDDYGRTFQSNDTKEWKRVVQEVTRFMKADAACENIRPLRYSVVLDPQPNIFPPLVCLGGGKPLRLKDALLASYHRNEVRFMELTLDTFRFLQCLEWEPSGSLYRPRVIEPNGAAPGHSGSLRLEEIMDQALPPNPHKYILSRPSITQLLLVMATICEELPVDCIVLLYLSASGSKAAMASIAHSGEVQSLLDPHGGRGPETIAEVHESSPSSSPLNISPDHASSVSDTVDGSPGSFETGLHFGSRGNSGTTSLYPSDILPFTRRPLFLVIDSDNSSLFEVLHNEARGEPSVLLLSPAVQPTGKHGDSTSSHQKGAGSIFTLFLAAPLLAFCQLVQVPVTSLAQAEIEKVQKILTSRISDWGKTLSLSSLEPLWVRIMWDPFLRQLLLRFIFCRACLGLHRLYGAKQEHAPQCMPPLPNDVLPSEAAIETCVYGVASSFGVVDQFNFSQCTLDA